MKKQTKQQKASNRNVNPQIQLVPFARIGTKDEGAMFFIAIQPSSSQQNVASLFGWEVIAMPAPITRAKSSVTTRRRGA